MLKNKSKIAYIFNSYHEIKKLKKRIYENKSLYIFNSYPNNEFTKLNYKILDFYCNDKIYNKYDLIKDYLCKNWFKTDYRSENNLKINLIGNILISRLHSDFTDKLRIYLSLEKISKNYDKVFFSSKLPKPFINVSKYFNNCKEFKSTIGLPNFLHSVVERSTYRYSPKIHKLSKTARVVQSLIPQKKIYNKILAFSDPYYDNYLKKRKDVIFLNNLNPFSGYYFNTTVEKKFFFTKKHLSSKFVKNNLSKLIKKQKITLNKKILNILCESIVENFNNGLKFFNWSYDHYFEILDHYKPIKIIFPNIISFDYLIVNYLAKTNKINSLVCLDGIETIYNPLSIIFDNNKFIYDKLICYGEADYKLNLAHKINKNQLILSKFPIKKKHKLYKKKFYDFIIMAYQPRTNNLNSRWDKRYSNSIEIIGMLNSLGYNKIAIKIKPDNKNLNPEINFLKKLIKQKNYSCQILTGNIIEHMDKTKNIIGGISTSVWESAFLNIPYYIYEPKNMGLLDKQIKNSIIFGIKDATRNILKLKKNIINKNFFKPNKKIMFNGTPLEKLKI